MVGLVETGLVPEAEDKYIDEDFHDLSDVQILRIRMTQPDITLKSS